MSEDTPQNQPAGYEPEEVWAWEEGNGGRFANINRPTSGATQDKELPIGEHPIQLYSLGTPNGVKVTVLLEELLEAGHADAEYDAWMVNISEGDQFGSGFVDINPNSKIPAMMDHSTNPPTRIFESGSMLLYLAKKFGAFLPEDHHKQTETINWLMWQMGSAPFLGGGFGHFYAYAPFKMKYPIDRYTMEVKRQLHLLDTHLAENEFMIGDDYTIADMAIWPWYGMIMREGYNAQTFLNVKEYENVERWTSQIGKRPGAHRGSMVNRPYGNPETQLLERHSAKDFEVNTQDKVMARDGERV